MPSYAGTGQAQLLYENTQKYFWQNETVATSTLSVAYELRRVLGAYYPWGLSVEVIFSGNPGAFEIDIMGANNDFAVNYVQLGNITVTNNSTSGAYVGRWDMPTNVWPKYVAGYLKALGNSVNVTLQVTR
jgi:hypothetical protein